MSKTKVLNFIDIIRLKKDFLRDKYYYGLFNKTTLIDSITYSHAFYNDELIEIHDLGLRNQDLINNFIENFASKKSIRYFISEFDERTQAAEIEFMNSCAFKRLTRNYFYEYNGSVHSPNERLELNIFCREADHRDIPSLIEKDIDAQIIEYRDALYRPKDFFKKNLSNIYVFSSSTNLQQVLAYCFKRTFLLNDVFEFIVHPKQSMQIFDFIHAFAEHYVHFSKISNKFDFALNESLDQGLGDIAKSFKLLGSSQVLIREGLPREKVKLKVVRRAIASLRAERSEA